MTAIGIQAVTSYGRMKMCGVSAKYVHYFTGTKFSGCLCPCLVELIIYYTQKKKKKECHCSLTNFVKRRVQF